MNDTASISIKNFRAIKEATININGITVVSGINGSGKSTISSLLYYIYKYANDYQRLIEVNLRDTLRPYLDVLDQFRYYAILPHRKDRSRMTHIPMRRFSIYPLDDNTTTRLNDYFDEIINSLNSTIVNKDNSAVERLKVIICDSLGKKPVPNLQLVDLINQLQQEINSKINKAISDIETRPVQYLKNVIADKMGEPINKIDVYDLNESLYGSGISNIPIPHFIKKVVYINTPMSVGYGIFNPRQPGEWEDLNNLLSQKPQRSYSKLIYNFIRDEVIEGEAKYIENDFDDRFIYTDNKGRTFDLTECATGIRSFSAIQILLKNRIIDKDTLLILDEPEAHLHPQWIIEYARLLILIHKRIGTKLFIASHSTDMVSAIKSIGEKEKVDRNLSFYLAERSKKDDSFFSYRSLGLDIEPIFESFNKSFEYIDKYSNNDEYSGKSSGR